MDEAWQSARSLGELIENIAKRLPKNAILPPLLGFARTLPEIEAWDQAVEGRLNDNNGKCHFFYGIPAPPPGDWGDGYLHCFVMKPDSRFNVHSIYPFDSGGAKSGRYRPAIGNRVILKHYQLSTDLSRIPVLVQTFFGDNEGYLAREPIVDSNTSYAPCIKNYLKVIWLSGKMGMDIRCRTVEVSVTGSVGLSGTLEAVIAPTTASQQYTRMLEDQSWQGCQLLWYTPIAGEADREHLKSIRDKLTEYWREREKACEGGS